MLAAKNHEPTKPKAATAPNNGALRPEAPRQAEINPVWHNLALQSLTRAFPGAAGEPPPIQAKLTISQPNDPAEIEADHVADKVMRMPVGEANPVIVKRHHISKPDKIHTKCAECEMEEEVPETLQRKEGFASAAPVPPGEGSSLIRDVLNSGGRPLDGDTRGFFEPRLGMDLGQVRIHTDSNAAQSARTIDARAYALGSNIVFDSGEFSPRSDAGTRLLAHELAHVGQQRSNPERNIIRRQPKPSPAPAGDAPVKDLIGVSVFLDKDCRALSDDEYANYALLLFVVQTFGTDKSIAAEVIKSVSMTWVNFKPIARDKRTVGARVDVSVKKDFYRLVLSQIYGSDAPFIDSMVDALYRPAGVATEKELKDLNKSRQLEHLKGKLSPLDWEYIKSHYNVRTGGAVDKQLEDIRKLRSDLEAVKKDPVAWFKFLKTQLTPKDFYHQIAAEFKRLESLFFHTVFSKALTVQADPQNRWYKTDMQQLYKEYPWLQQAESEIKAEAAKFTSSDDQQKALQQELQLNGFRDMAHYEEFAVMFVDAFRDVVALKIEEQLKINEEIVQKEQTHYASGDLSKLQDLFRGYKQKLEFIRGEREKIVHGTAPYDRDMDIPRAVHMLEVREKEIHDEITRKRKDYSYAYPILDDPTLSNSDLLIDDSKILQVKLLAVTKTRLGNITKTRENLKKSPEKFVFMVADRLYVRKAMEDLFIDESSLEAFVIKGRIDKMQADETLKNIALAALTIGLGLISLPFTGTAAALASIPGFALGIYSSVEEVHQYRMRLAAAGTAFNVKDAILKEEPSLFWLIVGLAGTALDGLIITRTFAKLAKSRYLKYGLPERKFLQEVEDVLLKEAGHLEPDKLKTLLKEVEKKVAEAEELESKFAKAADSLATAAAKIAKVAAKTDVAVIDKLAESVYWAIRRGIKTSDDFLKEAKNAEKIDRVLIDDCFKQLHAAMPGGKGLSPSAFQDVLLQIYKNNGYELVEIFVRNEKTRVGAFLTAMKKADGKYEFLDLAGMTPNAKAVIKDIEKGESALRLAKDSKLKGVNLDQVRALGVPTKVLSDLPAVQGILKTVDELQRPLNDLRRQARKLSEETEKLSTVANPNPTMVAAKTQKLADLQKELAGQGKKLLAEADKLEKEAALITDKAQKSKLLSEVESIRKDATLLDYDIKVQDAFNRRTVLRDILETAKKFGGNALYYEAHHLIPVEMIPESSVLRKAIEGGFDFNGLINGINLPQFSSKFRTQNIIVEMLENGTKARIIEGTGGRLVTVEVAADGKRVFKFNDQIVGELTYTRQLQPDGTIIEGGKISLNKGSDVVSETLKESPFGVHSSHPNYTAYVKAKLDDIGTKLGGSITPQQARQEVEHLVAFLRSKLEQARQTPGFKIDDLFNP
jgi:Domain of unknown function (DUF4157)